MNSFYVELSILEVSVAQIFALLIISNVNSLKLNSSLVREELTTVVSTTTADTLWRNNRHDSLDIKLHTHIPKSLQTIILIILRTLTSNHKTEGDVLLVPLIDLVK